MPFSPRLRCFLGCGSVAFALASEATIATRSFVWYGLLPTFVRLHPRWPFRRDRRLVVLREKFTTRNDQTQRSENQNQRYTPTQHPNCNSPQPAVENQSQQQQQALKDEIHTLLGVGTRISPNCQKGFRRRMVLEKIGISGSLPEFLQGRFALLFEELNQSAVLSLTVLSELFDARFEFLFVPLRRSCHHGVDVFFHVRLNFLPIVADDMFVVVRLYRWPMLLKLFLAHSSRICNPLL